MAITIDKGHSLPVYSPVCTFCRHLDMDGERTCAAFDEIPEEIWRGDHDHRAPYPGDGGVQFEEI